MLPDGPLFFIRGEGGGGTSIFTHRDWWGRGREGTETMRVLSLSFSSLLYTPVNREEEKGKPLEKIAWMVFWLFCLSEAKHYFEN